MSDFTIALIDWFTTVRCLQLSDCLAGTLDGDTLRNSRRHTKLFKSQPLQ